MGQLRKCAKNGCIEGEERSFGRVTFVMRQQNGDLYANCDHCISYRHEKQKDQHEDEYDNYPAPREAIYGLFLHQQLIYVGESQKTSCRLADHMRFKKRSALVDLPEYERKFVSYKILWDGTNKSKQDRLMLESVLIHSLRPEYNKQWAR